MQFNPSESVSGGVREPPSPLLVSIEDAARVLAVGRSMLYELVASGEIETVRIGRCRRVPVDALRRFVERRVSSD